MHQSLRALGLAALGAAAGYHARLAQTAWAHDCEYRNDEPVTLVASEGELSWPPTGELIFEEDVHHEDDWVQLELDAADAAAMPVVDGALSDAWPVP